MRVLGLETSCDETAAAVVEDGTRVLGHAVATQHDLHERYAGVVPEIASRAHVERVLPVVREALERAGVAVSGVDAVAVGNRPGLVGSLITGVSAAQALAWSLDRPLVGVDHVKAHLHAAQLHEADEPAPPPAPPGERLGLVISGGHTSLFRRRTDGTDEPLGRTIDDAIGEAYDKAGVLLAAGYPGGPNVDRLARTGDPDGADVPDLPVSMLGSDSLDFSFSGLKTALLYAVRGHPVGRGRDAAFPRCSADLTDRRRRDLAAAFQRAAGRAIERKLLRAVQRYPAVTGLVVGGGVSANSALRGRLADLADARGLHLAIPAPAWCVDNAAMIAGLAYERLARGERDPLDLPVYATAEAV